MRLGQLARKLGLRPSEVVDFLSSKSIAIEDGANARLEDDHVNLIVRKFTSFTSIEAFDNVKVEKAEQLPLPVAVPQEETIADESEVINNAVVSYEPAEIEEESDEKLEIIKAPKVELQGLKVLGKIELPEAKKKANINSEEVEADLAIPVSQPAPTSKPFAENRRQPPSRSPRPEQKPRKNPITAARELEQLEALKKREEQLELQKEQKTKNYYKKVKTVSPTKRARIIDEQSEEMVLTEIKEAPTSWLGKIARWFRT